MTDGYRVHALFRTLCYEVYVAPKQHTPAWTGLNAFELRDLAAVLKQTLVAYDNLWRYAISLCDGPASGAHTEAGAIMVHSIFTSNFTRH